MFYTYIIKSINFDSFYTGHSQDLNGRLLKHNRGYSKSTKAKAPWKLVYFEEFETRSKSAKREKISTPYNTNTYTSNSCF